jgi:hypothetical protein
MFDASPIEAAFERQGLSFAAVPGVRLPQRRFQDSTERRRVLSGLHDRGIDTSGWEDRGKHYADLCVAAPPEQLGVLLERMRDTRLKREGDLELVGYIQR